MDPILILESISKAVSPYSVDKGVRASCDSRIAWSSAVYTELREMMLTFTLHRRSNKKMSNQSINHINQIEENTNQETSI